MTMTEFLLARIAEDEKGAYSYREVEPEPGQRFNWTAWPSEQQVDLVFEDGQRQTMEWSEFQERHMERHLFRPRVLAECEAKRRIVEMAASYRDEDEIWWLLPALATVYADHPDYREEWAV